VILRGATSMNRVRTPSAHGVRPSTSTTGPAHAVRPPPGSGR
jgi:hypothetical protein